MSLELYHALISTCSQKVRLVLAEKHLDWTNGCCSPICNTSSIPGDTSRFPAADRLCRVRRAQQFPTHGCSVLGRS